MRKIAHISDIHFGRLNARAAKGLLADLHKEKLDLIIVSGDLTQRAFAHQFRKAKRFLDKLPTPIVVIPGNHDVPLLNLFDRVLRPFHLYRKYISESIDQYFEDDELAVGALNSARGFSLKNGWVVNRQIDEACEFFRKQREGKLKIMVTHHPFSAPEEFDAAQLIEQAPNAMEAFLDVGVDLFLAGHLHISFFGFTRERYLDCKRDALIISSGTSASVRGRGEPNSYNLITSDLPHLTLCRMVWDRGTQQFRKALEQRFVCGGSDWKAVDVVSTGHTIVKPTKHEVSTEESADDEEKMETPKKGEGVVEDSQDRSSRT